MSPRASCAYSVMPIRTEPACSPGSRTHSCSLVYFRSSGYTGLLGSGGDAPPVRLLRGVGLGVLRLARLHHGLDVERGELVDLDRGAPLLELVARPLGEVDSTVQGARLPDHVDDVRRGHQFATDLDAADGVLER